MSNFEDLSELLRYQVYHKLKKTNMKILHRFTYYTFTMG